jgi:uncharacterized protein (TIGR02246 family)
VIQTFRGRPVVPAFLFALGLLGVTPVPATAQGAPQWAQDLLAAWYAAYNAGDVQGVAKLYTEDAVVGTHRGRAAYAADLAARFARVKATCTGAFDGFQVAGASAVGWGRDQCTEMPKAGGPESRTRTKWIAVYAPQPDGRWLTVRDEGEPVSGGSIEAAAVAIAEAWIRTYDTRDLDGHMALYAPDARMLFWGTNVPSLDSVRTLMARQVAGRTDEHWTIDRTHVRVLSPTSALLQAVFSGRYTLANGQRWESRGGGLLTVLVEQRDTDWKIASIHMHGSATRVNP